MLANFPAQFHPPSLSKQTRSPQIYVPRHWRNGYAINSIAGQCCIDTIDNIIIEWLKQGHPLADIVSQFTLECTCLEHYPFCPDGVISRYRTPEGVIKCVQFIAQHKSRPRKENEIKFWTEAMIRHNEHSLVALVIEMVPSARNAIGQSLKQLWKTLSHLELYHAALKFGCISFDDKETNWLFNTRLTQPWPQSQRHVPQVFQEVTAHAELGRIALYFQKRWNVTLCQCSRNGKLSEKSYGFRFQAKIDPRCRAN